MSKVQFKLNLPVEVAGEVRRAALAANRSVTAEIVRRIAGYQEGPEDRISVRIDRLEKWAWGDTVPARLQGLTTREPSP